jgi:phage terminase large subunit GpA-like protein
MKTKRKPFRFPTKEELRAQVLARLAPLTGQRGLDTGVKLDRGLLGTSVKLLRPRPKEQPSEWIPRNCYLSADTEANDGGAYDLTKFPYWRMILDLVASPTVREVNLMISPQMGKTIAMVMILLFLAMVAPCPCMYVLPTQSDAIEFRNRVYANALASPQTKHLVPPESQWNTRSIDLGGLRCYLAWAGARNAIRSRRCRIVFLDEVDVYEGGKKGGDPVASAYQRVGAFHRWQVWKLTSPVPEVSRIAEACETSKMHHWGVKCPQCQHEQELRFFPHKDGPYAGNGGIVGIYDDAGNPLPAEEVKEHCRYLCEKGCDLPPAAKFEMMRGGRWVEGDGPEDRLGFTLPLYISDAKTLNEAAGAYAISKATGDLPGFFQRWLARSYTSKKPRPKWEFFARKNAGEHERGWVPSDVWFLTAGADVQDDRVYLSVWGWGHMKTRYLIDWRILYQREGDDGDVIASDLRQLDAFMTKRYPVIGEHGNPRGLDRLMIWLLGIDSGWRPGEVHDWVWKHRASKRVRAVRGDANVDPSKRWRPSKIEENARTGEKYKNPRVEWQLAVSSFKERLAKQMTAEIRNPGAVILPRGMQSMAPEFCKQFCNEEERTIVKENGRRVKEWTPKTKAIGVDQWDTSIYADACAEMIVATKYGRQWDTGKWPKSDRAAQAKLDSEGIVVR